LSEPTNTTTQSRVLGSRRKERRSVEAVTSTETTKTTNHYLKALAVLVALAVAMSSLLEQARPANAAFPGTNGKIALTSNRDGNPEIYSLAPDGSNPTNLSKNSAHDQDPAFSPDGKKIAFTSTRDGNYEIYVMNAKDGSKLTNHTSNRTTDEQPDWGAEQWKTR